MNPFENDMSCLLTVLWMDGNTTADEMMNIPEVANAVARGLERTIYGKECSDDN